MRPPPCLSSPALPARPAPPAPPARPPPAAPRRALVFCQTQQMLDILEKAVGAAGYSYHRMDGSTSVALRARLIDDFNTNDEGAWAGGRAGGRVGAAL